LSYTRILRHTNEIRTNPVTFVALVEPVRLL